MLHDSDFSTINCVPMGEDLETAVKIAKHMLETTKGPCIMRICNGWGKTIYRGEKDCDGKVYEIRW